MFFGMVWLIKIKQLIVEMFELLGGEINLQKVQNLELILQMLVY